MSAASRDALWKESVVELVLQRWSRYRFRRDVKFVESVDASVLIDDIPEKIKRSDKWILEYKRNPYLSSQSDYDLTKLIYRTTLGVTASMNEGPWSDRLGLKRMELFEIFAHIIEESKRRKVPMSNLSPNRLSSEDRAKIVEDFPESFQKFLESAPSSSSP